MVEEKATKRIVKCKRCDSSFEVENKKEWHDNKLPCPNCGELYCVFPPSEAKLRVYQDQFFDCITDYEQSNRIISKMYEILIPYTESLIKRYFRRYVQGNTSISDIAYMSVCNMIGDFLETREGRKKYKVRISFAGQLKLEIMDTLFGKKAKGTGMYKVTQKLQIPGLNSSNFERTTILRLTDGVLDPEWKPEIPRKFNPSMYDPDTDCYTIRFFKEIEAMSLDYEIEEGKTSLQISDSRPGMNSIDAEFQNKYLFDYLCELTESISQFTVNEFQDLKRMIGLCVFLERGEIAADKFFEKNGFFGKDMYLKTLEILKSELKEEAEKM